MDHGVLLETKLYPPQPPAGMVPRPGLVARLNDGLARRLTLVSAPAGFGKTTLLAEWAAQCPVPVGWLTLDEGDNDPARFLGYLLAALAKVRPALLQEVPAQESSSPAPLLFHTTLPPLINTIQRNPDSLVLVLDDFHLIETQAIHEAVTFLLDHPPPQLHLVIASRADPALPLSRLRARGQLLELRAADLRFTPQEAAAFLQQVTGSALPATDVNRLLKRTEGWAAGLQLAGLSLQRQQDMDRFISAFTGSHEYIADYLKDEVLNLQPESIRNFLLKTSILERLTGDLCDMVTGKSGGGETLAHLQEMNLFLQALDDERRWYRYHGLFADLLRHQLQLRYPDQVPELHRRASEWYASQGSYPEAIQHALQAGEQGRAAELVDAVAEEILMRSEISTLMRWVRQLPADNVRAYPGLCAYYAWALLISGQKLEQVEHWLEDLSVGEGEISPSVLTINAYLAIIQGDEARAGELARQALAALPQQERLLRSVALWIDSVAGLGQVDIAVRAEALSRTVSHLKESGNILLLVLALCTQAELRLWQGRLQEAETLYRQALEIATDAHGERLPVAGEALIGLGELAREWDQLETAAERLEEGIQLARQWSTFAALDGYIFLSQVRQSQGEQAEASALMNAASEIAEASDSTELDDLMADLARARLLIQQGHLEPARQWAQERGVDVTHPPAKSRDPASIQSRLRKYQRLAYARLLLREARPREALDVLEEVLPQVAARGRVRAMIEALILQALSHQALQDQTAALEAMRHALRLAKPGGFVRLFVDQGPPIEQLLYQAVEQDIEPEYAGRLLGAFPAPQPVEIAYPQAALIEALTPREQEVLTLIAEGQSNQEIAVTLVLAPSTVKVHTRNIYRKLDVSNRLQAVTRARELGII